MNDWGIGAPLPVQAHIFLLSVSSKPVLGSIYFISNMTGALTPETLLPGCALIILLSNAEVRNAWVCSSTDPHVYTIFRLIKRRD